METLCGSPQKARSLLFDVQIETRFIRRFRHTNHLLTAVPRENVGTLLMLLGAGCPSGARFDPALHILRGKRHYAGTRYGGFFFDEPSVVAVSKPNPDRKRGVG